MKLRSVLNAAGTLLALSLSLPTIAHPITYIGTMSNVGEPATAAGSLGTGIAKVVFDDDLFTMTVDVTFSGLTGITTASHIHCCTTVAGAGSTGVATPVPSFPGFPLGVQAGSYLQTFDMTQASSYNPAFVTLNGGTIPLAFNAFKTGLEAGEAYLNIHTSTSGGGEIRAFLTPAPVPVPATVLLFGSGLLGLGATLRRRFV